MKIEEMNFSVRAYHCLKRAKIDTIEQLSRMKDNDLMRISGFGLKCLEEVRSKLPEPKKSNADIIRAMSDEELAWELMTWRMETEAKHHGVESNYPHTQATILEWLQQPAEVD